VLQRLPKQLPHPIPAHAGDAPAHALQIISHRTTHNTHTEEYSSPRWSGVTFGHSFAQPNGLSAQYTSSRLRSAAHQSYAASLHPNSRSRWACHHPIPTSPVALSAANDLQAGLPACLPARREAWRALALMPARCQIAPALDMYMYCIARPGHHYKGGTSRWQQIPSVPSIQSISSAHRSASRAPHSLLRAQYSVLILLLILVAAPAYHAGFLQALVVVD
jgi:hypothetical protein